MPGPANLSRWLSQRAGNHDDPLLFIESVPSPETRSYIKRFMMYHWLYRRRLEQDSPTLDEAAAGKWPVYHPQSRAGRQRAGRRTGLPCRSPIDETIAFVPVRIARADGLRHPHGRERHLRRHPRQAHRGGRPCAGRAHAAARRCREDRTTAHRMDRRRQYRLRHLDRRHRPDGPRRHGRSDEAALRQGDRRLLRPVPPDQLSRRSAPRPSSRAPAAGSRAAPISSPCPARPAR